MTVMRIVFENPELLGIVNVKDEHILNYDGEPVRTIGGSIISHKSEYLVQRIKGDVRPCPDGNGFYLDGWPFHMFSMQKDEVDGPLEDDWEGSMKSDRMLYLDENLRQERQAQLIINWLHEYKCELPNLWPKLGEKSAETIGSAIDVGERIGTAIEHAETNGESFPKPDAHFVATLREIYLELQPEERAFVKTCYFETGDVIYPIALALRKAKFSDYSFVCPGVECGLLEQHEYIEYAEPSDSKRRIICEIKVGESVAREFKSTLRWNLRSERNDDEMQYACMKTIAAFLNTDGGQLFIGVSDDGEIIGIEKDGFPDSDKYQLHLFALIKEYLGKPIATSVDTEMVELKGKHICLVKCKKSPKPVYLKFKNREEAYFVRTGPGTTKLSTSEAHKHITENFEN
jgi:hypothetical protein